MPKKINIEIGSKFGRLTVIKESFSLNRETYLPCICDCGEAVDVRSSYLRIGKTKSCGCLNREISSIVNTTHGMASGSHRKSTPEYRTWNSMLQRATNPKNHHYPSYGGRGIKVCERWLNFENFFEDMGERPEGMSLDRINNDGDYEPDNCRWTTRKVQQNNTRRNKKYFHNGNSYVLSELAEMHNIPLHTLYTRIKRKWDLDRALTTKVQIKKSIKKIEPGTDLDEPAGVDW